MPDCPSCGTENPIDARFCSRCGARLEQACVRCGAELGADARFCASCGQPVEHDGPVEERKVATALFVDLVDSTALADRTDPERVRAILKDYFSLVASTVQAWGGSVEKYAGDAVLAVFGIPRVREDDAARAVSAGAEVVERFAELAGEVERRHAVAPAIRVGIETGEVIAPTEVRPDRPLATGDALNVAARLQAAAPPGHVIVGERTFEATRELFRYDDPLDVAIKGKLRPVRTYRLIARIEGAVEAGPARNLEARIVGRERELAVLAGLLDEAIETRSPRLALVYGPAGIGKSRLVREAIAVAGSERPDLLVLRGRCPAAGQRITFWPLAEVVRAAAGISLDDGPGEAEAKLRRRTGEIMAAAGHAREDAEAATFALATTAGIAVSGNPLDQSRPLSVLSELARRWPQFVSALARRQPTIVVIEDLHWASDQVVEMLERLLIRSTGAIVLVATSRPEFADAHPGFVAGRSEVATIALRPLGRPQALTLLSNLLAAARIPKATLDQIVDTAEGNPLFLEEIVSRLIEAGTLELIDGGWVVADAEVALPDTINALLAARIDALPEEERGVLREAAVVGRVFWESPVAAAVGGDTVRIALGELERRGLVSMRPTSSLHGEIEYLFKHALIRDVAYAGMSLARRAVAHADVAEWLAELGRDRSEELAELVAAHYEAALGEGAELAWPKGSEALGDVRAKARTAYLAAGATARKRYALDTAIRLHQAAIELSDSEADRAVALEALGDDHDAAYDGDRAVPAWEEAIRQRQSAGDDHEALARLTMKIARMGAVRWGGFSTPMRPEVLDRHVDLGLASSPDPDTRAWLLVMRAAVGLRWIGFHLPDPVRLDERVHAAEDALRHADDSGDVALQANAVRMLASLLLANGQTTRGLELMRGRLDLIGGIADPRERHLVMIETAYTLAWVGGDAEAVIPMLLESLRLGRELRVHDHCHSTGTLIGALFLAGRWDEISAYLDEHLATFATDAAGTSCPFALGVFPQAAVVLANRGETGRAAELAASMPPSEGPVGVLEALQALSAIALGDPAAGRDAAQRVLDTGPRNFAEEPPVELFAMVEALVALEDWDALGRFLPEARRRSEELAMLGPSIDRAEGLAAAARGDAARAAGLLDRAAAGFEPVSAFEAARTREALASLDPSRRDDLLSEALATFDRLGARPHVDRVRASLALGTVA